MVKFPYRINSKEPKLASLDIPIELIGETNELTVEVRDFYEEYGSLSIRKDKRYDNVLVAVAGGIEPSTAEYALKMKADILIIGRYITSSKDIKNSMRQFINLLPGYSDIDLKRIHVDDDDINALKSK